MASSGSMHYEATLTMYHVHWNEIMCKLKLGIVQVFESMVP